MFITASPYTPADEQDIHVHSRAYYTRWIYQYAVAAGIPHAHYAEYGCYGFKYYEQ